HLLLLLLLGAAVKDGGAASLRAGCEQAADLVAQLPAGTPVAIRYSISGAGGPCYKVTANLEGRTVEGYLPNTAIQDTAAFDKARKQGGRIGASEVMDAVRTATPEAAVGASDNAPPQ